MMTVVMIVDLLLTLGAAGVGVIRWSEVGTSWHLAIVAAWLMLFGSLSRFLAGLEVIPDEGWGLVVGGIPWIMVLYICGAAFFLLLGIWKSSEV
jgi:xanthine/uracil permease